MVALSFVTRHSENAALHVLVDITVAITSKNTELLIAYIFEIKEWKRSAYRLQILFNSMFL